MQQIDHGPEVAALLDVHLEDVAQVVHRRAGLAQEALLLDRSGLGVGLGDDDAAERVAVLARNLVPDRLALVVAEADLPLLLGVEEDAPAILRHADEVEVRPAIRLHADRRAQVHLMRLETLRPHFLPPGEEVRLPLLEGALQAPVRAEVDVVRDALERLGHYVLR